MRQKLVWALVIVLVVAASVTACLKRNNGNSPSTQPKAVKQGGRLVYGSLQEPGVLTPYLSDLLSAVEVESLVFSGLVSMNSKLEWQPDLALTVPLVTNGGVSSDGLTITYKLRPGVKWHDGSEFTAADVKFTWQFIMNPKNPVVARQGYDKIVSVDTPDVHTVIMRFAEPYSGYLTLFPAILPQHILAQEKDITKASFNKVPIGTGPFIFKKWQLADAIMLDANPNYFRGRPRLDGIVYKILPDMNIMLTQLKAGAIDVISNLGQAQLDQVKVVSGMKVVITPNMVWEHIDFNLENPFFQDVRVRRAIALALDRQNMVTTTLRGTAVVANADQPPTSWVYNPALQPFTRNVNQAKNLLAEAGWKPGADGVFVKDGTRLSFNIATISSNKTRENMQLAIEQQLREVGIEATFSSYAPEYFAGNILRYRNFDMALYAFVVGADPDNTNLWNSLKIPTYKNRFDGQNYTGWKNPEIDALTIAGARTFDLEQRKNAYFRIQELIAQELPVIPLFFRANISVVKDTVANFQPSPTSAGNLWNAWEWGLREK
jgi:peptide/nickel transport system substrate-binding protein